MGGGKKNKKKKSTKPKIRKIDPKQFDSRRETTTTTNTNNNNKNNNSNQANTGTGRDGGFGTGTYGSGMPSNPSFKGVGANTSYSAPKAAAKPATKKNTPGSGIQPAAASNVLTTDNLKEMMPGLSPNSPALSPDFKPGPVGMSDPFAQPGPTPENTPEADYTSYQTGSFYNQSDTNLNVDNAIRSLRNVVTTPFRAVGIENDLTNKLIPKSNEAIQDARDNRKPVTLTKRKSGGGTNRIEQQVAATEILPETAAPIGTQQPFNYIQGGTDNSQLSRIQQQSYQDNLSRMMGSYGTMSTGAVGANTQGTGRVAPRLGSFRGRRRLMFAPKSSYMAQGSGPQDLLNRSGLRITSLNT